MFAKPSIAVIDNDPSMLLNLARLLERHGFDVRQYTDAESLLAEITELSPDCVLSGLSMPALSGLDLQRSLADLEVAFPIVFFTDIDDVKVSVRAMRGGAVDFLTKPVDQRDLLDAMDRAVSSGRAARLLSSSSPPYGSA